jgi:prephenate dehydrogenase
MVPRMPPPTVLIVGLGFMGGSLASALVQAGWSVLLHHRRSEVSARAAALGYGEQILALPDGMGRAQIAVVCTPVSTIVPLVRQLVAMPGQALISDIGSVKGPLCRDLADLSRAGRFIGSHPMAGSHLQGLEHARPDLFQGCTTVITPVPSTPQAGIALIERCWQAVGSRIHRLPPDEHDRAVAEVSHLPHIAAAAVAAGVSDASLALAASGFRDTTRVAAGDPALWADILLSNRLQVAQAIRTTTGRLHELLVLLEQGDAQAVAGWLSQGQLGRQRFELLRHLPAQAEGGGEE